MYISCLQSKVKAALSCLAAPYAPSTNAVFSVKIVLPRNLSRFCISVLSMFGNVSKHFFSF